MRAGALGICALLGGAAFAVYYIFGETPISLAVTFGLLGILGLLLVYRIFAALAGYAWGSTAREGGVGTMVKFSLCAEILSGILSGMILVVLGAISAFLYDDSTEELADEAYCEEYYMPVERDAYFFLACLVLLFCWSLTVLRYNQNAEVLTPAKNLLFGAVFYLIGIALWLPFLFLLSLDGECDLDFLRMITDTHSWGETFINLAVAFLPPFAMGAFVKKEA